MQSVTSVSEFDNLLSKNKYVFVDFYADWCGPCKMIAPVIQNLSVAKPHILFLKVNVEEAPELCSKFSISAMPTFLAFIDKEKVAEIVGANKSQIESVLASMN